MIAICRAVAGRGAFVAATHNASLPLLAFVGTVIVTGLGLSAAPASRGR